MGIAVLGPLEVDGHTNGLGPRDRVVLSALVVRAGEPVSAEALADALWGGQVPATWTKVVQGCVVRLRKSLGAAAIESGPAGYRLTLNDDEGGRGAWTPARTHGCHAPARQPGATTHRPNGSSSSPTSHMRSPADSGPRAPESEPQVFWRAHSPAHWPRGAPPCFTVSSGSSRAARPGAP